MAKLPNGQMAKLNEATRRGKGRLLPSLLDRTEEFADRCFAVAEELDADGRYRRFIEQLAACSSSVGANVAEADEAMSDKDFRKCLCIAVKELAETRFFLRVACRRGWITVFRMMPLLAELHEIKSILGSILTKTAPKPIRTTVESKRRHLPL